MSIDPSWVHVLPGDTQLFTAQVLGGGNPNVTWSVQEATGGTIDPSGLYTPPVGVTGTFHVVATSVEAPDASASAEVAVYPVVTIELLPQPAEIAAGGTLQLTAVVHNSSDQGVEWGAYYGTISAGGLYTAPASMGPTGLDSIYVYPHADPLQAFTFALTVTQP